MLLKRACVSLRPCCQGSSEQHQNTRASGSGWNSRTVSINSSASGTAVRRLYVPAPISLANDSPKKKEKKERGVVIGGGEGGVGWAGVGWGDITAQHSHQTVCLSAPRGNQFNSPQLLAGKRERGWRNRGQSERESVCACVCLCVFLHDMS